MTSPSSGSCPWPIDTSCCSGWYDLSPQVREAAQQSATDVLWALSGRQFTVCESTIRPCRRPCTTGCSVCGYTGDLGLSSGGGSYLPWVPALIEGRWYNLTCPCNAPGGCQCGETVEEVELPGPVASVTAVYVDGKELPDSAWCLYGPATLTRLDGGTWPRCQNLAASLDQPGTWGVTYVRGTALPEAARRAAGALACELARSCTGGKCRIPWQVTSVTRDGVSWTFDPSEFYSRGLTGLPEVDLWLTAVNPRKLVRRPGVYTPQTLRKDRQRRGGEVLP